MQIAGGLGNQLFQYATGRAIANRSGIPLTIDDLSGFSRDFYNRQFRLDLFNTQYERIAPSESMATATGRIKRHLYRWIDRDRPLANRSYIEEPDPERPTTDIAKLKIIRPVVMAGYWQFDEYFNEIREQLLEELTLRVAHDAVNRAVAEEIRSVNAVGLHVRRLHGVANVAGAAPLSDDSSIHLSTAYYKRSLECIMEKLERPHFFVFADYPTWARQNITVHAPIHFVDHNGPNKEYEDLWLMSQCRHFIIANSTFSWWAAWLGSNPGKCVIAPKEGIPGPGLKSVPTSWQRV